jgi:hypothetical protein
VRPHHSPCADQYQLQVLSHIRYPTRQSRYYLLRKLTWRAMLLTLNIQALVSLLCLTLPQTITSSTAKQWHERYHLLLGFV